ncbi:MAG: thymidine phosphorylase family protein [Caulobacteraceae bacterium]
MASDGGASPRLDLHTLAAKRIGVFSQGEVLVFMRRDCFVCRSEGLAPRSRVLLRTAKGEAIATLLQVSKGLLRANEVGLSDAAWQALGVAEGDPVHVSHPRSLTSTSALRRRIFANRLETHDFDAVIADVARGNYSEVEVAAFVTACSTLPLDEREVLSLTRAMVNAGERLSWSGRPVLDKHSVGGLPGNRTTPIVVAIVAAHGLTIPKTSSRAITSPSGTADCMETLTRVDLSVEQMRSVVAKEGGCLAWGGSMRLSPADDILIRVERALDIDPEGQLVASILSKKIAAGSTHVVIDMPIGATAKVRDEEKAARLKTRLESVGASFGLTVTTLTSDGDQPVGRGIGPALEARDVLAVLQGSSEAPADLAEKSCVLAGALLEIGGVSSVGEGTADALGSLNDGRAWRKFQAICEAQGGLRQPPVAAHRRPLTAKANGQLVSLDNRRLSRLAKLAGAPDHHAAGVDMHVRLGDAVETGSPLCSLHAGSEGELQYALDYAAANPDIFGIAVP